MNFSVRDKEVVLWKVIFIRLIIMLLLLSTSRAFLYLFNIDSFPNISFSEFITLFFTGFRFDINTLVIFNVPLLVLYGIPFRFKYNQKYKKCIDIIFIVTNSITIALNLIDVIYFRFIDKRMCSELFTFFKGTEENQAGLMFSFIADFWYMFILFFLILYLIIILTKKTRLKNPDTNGSIKWYIRQTLSFAFIIFWSVIGIRGGFQLKPISLVTASNYTTKYVPLVINTPFSIIYGSTTASIEKVNYFDSKIIDSLYCPVRNELTSNRYITKTADNYNMVLIILEGIGQEMIGFYNPRYKNSLTPFLDSLLSESLTFDGMANGRRSIESLPSILSGLPSLMATDYPSSRYSVNRLEGFGSNLKEHGYSTSFFHGGNNGTMSFYSTSKSSGFDSYYGRNEYNNDKDYDGTWGIFDMPFLQYSADIIDKQEEPFASVIYTLSSHMPYALPNDYVMPDSTIKSSYEKTVRYTDDALAAFFNKISKYEWFKNTVFIITSDHSNPLHYFDEYKNEFSSYKIPIAFFAPDIFENKKVDEIAQQVDIAASILCALNINDSIFTFGRNLFDSTHNVEHISYLNNIYQFYDGKHLLQSDGNDIIAIYDIKKDPALKDNIFNKNELERWNEIDMNFKLRLQQYNNRMINNTLYR